jgi:hypothetical protein
MLACSAEVYRARCLTNNRIVGIKALNLEWLMTPLDEVMHEAQIMKVGGINGFNSNTWLRRSRQTLLGGQRMASAAAAKQQQMGWERHATIHCKQRPASPCMFSFVARNCGRN